MLLFRIEKNEYKSIYPSVGSKFSEGRWNTKDMWVVYTSENIALAKLETLANSGNKVPKDRFLLILEVEDDAPLIEITTEDLPSHWASSPYPKNLAVIIKGIMDTGLFVGAIVPSAQSPRERNVLLFPDFHDFEKYVKKIEEVEEYFDIRLKMSWSREW